MLRFSAFINLPLTFRDYRREHGRKFVCFLKTTLVLYTGFFCTFANITDVEGIYKGVVSVFLLHMICHAVYAMLNDVALMLNDVALMIS